MNFVAFDIGHQCDVRATEDRISNSCFCTVSVWYVHGHLSCPVFPGTRGHVLPTEILPELKWITHAYVPSFGFLRWGRGRWIYTLSGMPVESVQRLEHHATYVAVGRIAFKQVGYKPASVPKRLQKNQGVTGVLHRRQLLAL